MRTAAYAVAAALATLTFAAPANAYVFGVADGNPAAAPIGAQLGAKTYRLVMDSKVPLDAYAQRIEAYRAAGMRPQIVVDGTGTWQRGRTGKNWQTINYAIHAFKRWPDAYSVSVMNEPNLSGISVCQYAKTFRRAYKMLKAAGVPRVLFGEFSPSDGDAFAWTRAAMKCVGTIVADGWAWHCYDMGGSGIRLTPIIRRKLDGMWRKHLHTRSGKALPMFCTEFGVMTQGAHYFGEQDGANNWARALRIVRRYHVEQIVAWQLLEQANVSGWDTSLYDATGRARPAVAVIASIR